MAIKRREEVKRELQQLGAQLLQRLRLHLHRQHGHGETPSDYQSVSLSSVQ
uniref:Uncharacterized protein n=1 Tax=Kalanchoe fedtschenkoi TaxID=63787 RepID=A0A7N1A8C2_KALFE